MHLEEQSAHHRRQCKGDDRRDKNCHAQGHCKFPEQATDDVPHEKERNQNRDQRHTERYNGETDLRSTLEGCLQRLHPFLYIPNDILNHHDRIIDDETGRYRQRHQCQIVERITQHVHDSECTDEGKGDSGAGDDGGSNAMQKNIDDDDDETNGEQQLVLNTFHRSTNGGGSIRQHLNANRRRQRFLQLRQHRFNPIHHIDDIGTGLTLDVEQDSRLRVMPRCLPNVFDIIDHVGDLF